MHLTVFLYEVFSCHSLGPADVAAVAAADDGDAVVAVADVYR